MNIIFIAADTDKIGGIEKYNKEFMSVLRENGAKVVFVPLRGITIVQKFSFVFRIFWKTFFGKPDFIFCSHIAFSPICYFIKKIFRIDYSVNIYGIEVVKIKSIIHKKALKSAKYIIKLFDQAEKNVTDQIPEVAGKFINLPNFVDSQKFYIKNKSKELIKKYDLEGVKIIFTLCRLSHSEVDNKGYEKVIKVMPEIIKEIPNAKYLLAGGGDDLERMKKLVKELNLGNNVIFSGPVKDEELVDYYNLADVFAFPSKNEGFPAFVLLEALACGRSIIGGSQGEKSEKNIFDNKLGYIINPDNKQELKKSIINILNNKAPESFFNPDYIRKEILNEYGKNIFKERIKAILDKIKNPRLAIIMSHPIQYQMPLLRKIANSGGIDLITYFNWDFGVGKKEFFDPEFKTKIKWDIPVLDGYKYKFLKNFSLKPSSDFFGQLNFGIIIELVKNRYDVVLLYGWNSFVNWLAFFTALIIGTRVILQSESPLNQELLKCGYKQKIKEFIFKKYFFPRISAFLYIGEENKKFYQHFGVSEEKLFFVPYAVDNERYTKDARELEFKKHELREGVGIAKEDVAILFVGKLIEKKRPMDLLLAYQQLTTDNQQFKNKIHLLYVGDGILRKELENYCKKNELENVHFVGFKNQTELAKYYVLSDIFVLPSGVGETWGLVVNEAMCFSLPVIVSNVVGCGLDLVKNGENGYIFPISDTKKLSESLGYLINNKEKRGKFGKKSFEIIQNYSHGKDVDGILSALNSIKK